MNKKILSWHDKKSINTVSEELKKGGAVVGTSDTVFGLLAMANEQGLLLLNSIKGRAEKPYIVLIGDKSRLVDFTDQVSAHCQALVDACWPGPLTVIIRAKEGLPPGIGGGNGTIAIRVPRHDGLLELLKIIPSLFSTSANKAGMPVPGALEDIDLSIVEGVSAVIVDTVLGLKAQDVKPSTIVDCTQVPLKIVRSGAYSLDFLTSIIGKDFLGV